MMHQNEETPLHKFKMRYDLFDTKQCENCGIMLAVHEHPEIPYCDPSLVHEHV